MLFSTRKLYNSLKKKKERKKFAIRVCAYTTAQKSTFIFLNDFVLTLYLDSHTNTSSSSKFCRKGKNKTNCKQRMSLMQVQSVSYV